MLILRVDVSLLTHAHNNNTQTHKTSVTGKIFKCFGDFSVPASWNNGEFCYLLKNRLNQRVQRLWFPTKE